MIDVQGLRLRMRAEEMGDAVAVMPPEKDGNDNCNNNRGQGEPYFGFAEEMDESLADVIGQPVHRTDDDRGADQVDEKKSLERDLQDAR